MHIPRAEAIKLAYLQIEKRASASNEFEPERGLESGKGSGADVLEKERSQNRARHFAGAILGAPQGLGAAFMVGEHLPQELMGSWTPPVGAALGLGLGGLAGYTLPGMMGAMAGFEAGAPIGGTLAHAIATALDKKDEDVRAATVLGSLAGGLPLGYLGYKLMHPTD